MNLNYLISIQMKEKVNSLKKGKKKKHINKSKLCWRIQL